VPAVTPALVFARRCRGAGKAPLGSFGKRKEGIAFNGVIAIIASCSLFIDELRTQNKKLLIEG